MAELAIGIDALSIQLGGTSVVDAVSLGLHFGELGVIAGPNGAGKSTLLRAVLGLSAPHSGRISISGRDLASLRHADRSQTLSYVPQTSALNAALSVHEIVAQGRFSRNESRARTAAAVEQALERTGIRALQSRSYLALSGGERRLALIARALCTEAKIVLLDEPTAGLDIANRLRILELLRSLAGENFAVLAVLHDLDDVLNYADSVALMHRGKIVYSGTAKDVVTAEHVRGVYGVELVRNAALGFSLPKGATP